MGQAAEKLTKEEMEAQEPLKIQEALDSLRESYPRETENIEGRLRKDVVALGTDEAFALKDDGGTIRAFAQKLTLSAAGKTLIQPTYEGPWTISAQGYEVWAETAGAAVIFPDNLIVDNKRVSNPFVERDPENRRILAVHARAVAFRFSSKGIPQVSDWTTIFDTPSYRMIDLLAKAKKKPQAFKLLPTGTTPQEVDPEAGGTWAKYDFDEAAKLWVNTSHDEALQWFSQIINREKKSLDFAQTFAKRNALKHLSGLQQAPGPVWNLKVLCWRPTSGNIIKWDGTQYAQLRERVGGLVQGRGEEFRQIEFDHGVEKVSEDEDAPAIEPTIDPEDQEGVIEVQSKPVKEPEPPQTEPEESTTDATTEGPAQAATSETPAQPATETPTVSVEPNVDQNLLKQYEYTRSEFEDEHNKAVANLKMKPPFSEEDITTITKEVSRILDAGAM